MANQEREQRKKYVVKNIGTNSRNRDSDTAIGEREADIFFEKVIKRPGGEQLLKKLSESGDVGTPESSLETSRRINGLPLDAYEFISTMSSYLLAEDLARDYLAKREHRLMAANMFRGLGVKGKELGFVMNTLHDLAVGNAQPRRRPINRRSI